MSIFHYPFQKILELKEKEKEGAQKEMAKAIQRQEKIELRLADLHDLYIAAQEQFAFKQEQGTVIVELRRIEDYVEHLRRCLRLEQEDCSFAKKNVDKKQEVLHDKLKEEKTWFVLKERQELEFINRSKLQEQKQLDEVASNRYYRLSQRGDEFGKR